MPAASDPERKMIPEAQYVAEKNWIIEDYGGGGDCLFRALSASSDPEVFLKLRQKIVIEEQEAGLVQKGFVDANLMGMLENSSIPNLEICRLKQFINRIFPLKPIINLWHSKVHGVGIWKFWHLRRLGHQSCM